jgi:uncharacterized protein
MMTLDTSALYALVNRRDPAHARIRALVLGDDRPLLVPAGILAEIAYLIEQRLPHVLDAFLGDLESGALTIVCEEDVSRIRNLVSRYASLPLGVADASVIACAERHGGRVATLDRRHFPIVAREGLLAVLPAD